MTLDRSAVTWNELPNRPPLRWFRASMPGPFPGTILEQSKLVNMDSLSGSYVGTNHMIAMMKHDVEDGLVRFYEQLAADPNARMRYRHSIRGTRGTL